MLLTSFASIGKAEKNSNFLLSHKTKPNPLIDWFSVSHSLRYLAFKPLSCFSDFPILVSHAIKADNVKINDLRFSHMIKFSHRMEKLLFVIHVWRKRRKGSGNRKGICHIYLWKRETQRVCMCVSGGGSAKGKHRNLIVCITKKKWEKLLNTQKSFAKGPSEKGGRWTKYWNFHSFFSLIMHEGNHTHHNKHESAYVYSIPCLFNLLVFHSLCYFHFIRTHTHTHSISFAFSRSWSCLNGNKRRRVCVCVYARIYRTCNQFFVAERKYIFLKFRTK